MSKQFLKNLFEKESVNFNLWLPITFALGIATYFSLDFEPQITFPLIAFILSVISFFITKSKNNLALIFLIFIFFLGGFCRISQKAQSLNTHFIQRNYDFVKIKGRIENITSKENNTQILLTQITSHKISDIQKTNKIQITTKEKDINVKIGDIISVIANLSPPSLPVYPDSFNTARNAYFQKIGAFGIAVSKIFLVQKSSKIPIIENTRNEIEHRIEAALGNTDSSTIIKSLSIGKQEALSNKLRKNYTAAGIVHILSISGFHMTLIAGFIFLLFRFLFALFPSFAERYNTKKICAVLALIGTFLYLLLSGSSIPAIRAFLMTAFVLIAILLDRQALSLRSLSWSGFLILLIWPQAITNVSFILSFSACYALLSGYETFHQKFRCYFNNKPFWLKWTIGSFLFFFIINTLIFTAIAPIVIQHFNTLNIYSLVGNFCTSALFSLLVMPLIFISIIMMPFSLEKPFLIITDYLIEKINLLCEWIASLPYATINLPPMSTSGYILFLISLVWFCCWKTKIRYLAVFCMLYSLFSICFHKIPDIIISENGKTIAVQKQGTLFFNKQSSKLEANWRTRNGLNKDIENYVKIKSNLFYKNFLINLSGRDDGIFDIIVNNHLPCKAKKMCISKEALKKEGTHLLYIENKNIRIKTAGNKNKNRIWNSK